MVPFLGYLFFASPKTDIALVIWADLIVLGFFTWIKMWCSAKPINSPDNERREWYMLVFAITLLFLILFLPAIFTATRSIEESYKFYEEGIKYVFPFFLSHLSSFFLNFVLEKEYSNRTYTYYFSSAWKRIAQNLIPLILLMAFYWYFQSKFIIVFIILRIYLELSAHFQEHGGPQIFSNINNFIWNLINKRSIISVPINNQWQGPASILFGITSFILFYVINSSGDNLTGLYLGIITILTGAGIIIAIRGINAGARTFPLIGLTTNLLIFMSLILSCLSHY